MDSREARRANAVRFVALTKSQRVCGIEEHNILHGDVQFDDFASLYPTIVELSKSAASAFEDTSIFNIRPLLDLQFVSTVDVEGVRQLLQRAAAEKLSYGEFSYLVKMITHRGMKVLELSPTLAEIAVCYSIHFNPAFTSNDDEALSRRLDRVEYEITFRRLCANGNKGIHPYFNAGISPQVAAEVVSAGKGLAEAISIQEGINIELTEGWL